MGFSATIKSCTNLGFKYVYFCASNTFKASGTFVLDETGLLYYSVNKIPLML